VRRLKSRKARAALGTLGLLIALCIPAAQASATVPTWHLGQSNLSELGKTVEYTSSGTATLTFTIGYPTKIVCSVAGQGVLSGESSLTFSGCEAYRSEVREKNCDPLPFTINFSASMQSRSVEMEFLPPCPIPSPLEIRPGEMKLAGGTEAFKPNVSLSESTKFGATLGTITGSIGMLLKSPFAGKSFGLGPAPLVHLAGKTLAEMGKTELPFSSTDSLTIDMGGVMPTFSCTGTGFGTLRPRGLKQEEVTLNCVVVGAEKTCYVEPVHIGFTGSFEGGSIFYLHTEDAAGKNCTVDEYIEFPNPSGYFSYGAEAKPLSVTKYAETSAWGGTIISGESKWSPSGGYSGTLGVW
jgi:hypothetical protein